MLPFFAVAASLGLILALRGPSPAYYLFTVVFLFFVCLQRVRFRQLFLSVAAAFLLYYLVGLAELERHETVHNAGEQTLPATIVDIPLVDGDRMTMRIKGPHDERLLVQAYMTNESEQHLFRSFSPGDRCMISGSLTRPVPPTNFAQFDYPQYLKEQQHIYWIVRARQGGINCYQTSLTVRTALQRWRQTQMQTIEETVSPKLAGIMTALLFGERLLLDEEILQAYQQLGVIHLLAISGLHVGLVTAAAFYGLIRFDVTRERAFDLLFCFLPVYMIIAGAAPPVIRASCMTMAVLVCLRFQLRLPPLTAVVAVYMMYLLIKPTALFQLGFQLSFLITFALLVSAPLIERRYAHPIARLLCITTLSQLMATPLILFHFYEISWISIFVNLFYVPFISFCVLPLVFLGFILSFWLPFDGNPILVLLEWGVSLAHTGLTELARHRWTMIITGKPSFSFIIVFYGVLVYGCLAWERGKQGWWRVPACLLVILLAFQMLTPYLDGRAKVTMLDVGQGDSFLLELPYRKEVYLLDTGGTITYFDEEWRRRRRSFDVGADIVVPELKARGIRQIDRLILSHGHLDHIGGAVALNEALRIKEVLYGSGDMTEHEREILTALQRQAPIRVVRQGESWTVGGNRFAILAPNKQAATDPNVNERSIVLYAEIEGVSFLFTGDLEEEGERRLLAAYPSLEVDILKVGHHGSRTSTTEEFVEQLKPSAAFISAGRNNHFGHPHPEVLTRLATHHVGVWQSNQGAVRLYLKDGQLNVVRPSKAGELP
ncbi:DNA internalization-related competence protein ComEC/Rec2 [Alkalihalobacillus oceani]|uniref:DNA internalization-related competence protein ComEC/Rec2 n=1 Tax=Halalkalibacter oceani TaxID=1653776 RepID=UPI002040A7EF|nr:DNA internalization-related competence protein ComEC/Rec2 [Halalkalibacter oceani]